MIDPAALSELHEPDTVVVSTLNDLKGFEFNLVLIVGCDEGVCPAGDVAEGEVYTQKAREDLDRGRTEAFHRWVTPKNLSSLRASRFGPWRRLGRKALQKVDQKFRNLGILRFMEDEQAKTEYLASH